MKCPICKKEMIIPENTIKIDEFELKPIPVATCYCPLYYQKEFIFLNDYNYTLEDFDDTFRMLLNRQKNLIENLIKNINVDYTNNELIECAYNMYKDISFSNIEEQGNEEKLSIKNTDREIWTYLHRKKNTDNLK